MLGDKKVLYSGMQSTGNLTLGNYLGALKNLSLIHIFRPGEILGLVGESGSGKSTLIKAAMGLLGDNGLVTRGDITFKGESLVDMPERELRRIRCLLYTSRCV